MKKMMMVAVALSLALAVPMQSWAKKSRKSKTAAAVPAASLKDNLGQYFHVGVALGTWVTSDGDAQADSIVDRHFNSIVAENCFKGEVVTPAPGKYDFRATDSVALYAQKHNLQLIGHCLVWHSQPPRWFFTYDDGTTVSRDELIRRMQSHIRTMVGRYKGIVGGWDVINEAFEDDGSYRETPYYKIIGPEYFEIAFRTAHEADPDVELYLNDYSLSKPAKREAVCRMVRSLKAKGLRIDAVGMQSHNGMDYPDLADYEASIDSLSACGVKVMMAELDLNMLPAPEGFGGAAIDQKYDYDQAMNPYANGLTEEMADKVNQRWLQFFDIYQRHRDQISRITFWGLRDHESWLNDWPIKGRTQYPLLMDRQGQGKPVINDIINLFK